MVDVMDALLSTPKAARVSWFVLVDGHHDWGTQGQVFFVPTSLSSQPT